MYPWLIFGHILGVFGFLLAHGASAAVAFRLRGERDVERVRVLLDLSRGVTAVSSISLLVLLTAGIVAGFMGGWWGHYWIWASLGLFILIGVAMTPLASRPLNRIRQIVQPAKPSASKPDISTLPGAAMDQQLAAMLAATHPVLLTAIGGGGLVLILWMMMFKPF